MCSFWAWLGFVLVIVMTNIPSGVSDSEAKNTAKFKALSNQGLPTKSLYHKRIKAR